MHAKEFFVGVASAADLITVEPYAGEVRCTVASVPLALVRCPDTSGLSDFVLALRARILDIRAIVTIKFPLYISGRLFNIVSKSRNRFHPSAGRTSPPYNALVSLGNQLS